MTLFCSCCNVCYGIILLSLQYTSICNDMNLYSCSCIVCHEISCLPVATHGHSTSIYIYIYIYIQGEYTLQLVLGKLSDNHYPYPNYANPRYPILNSDSDFDYPKLVWVIRVISPGTRTTRITRIFVYIFVFIMC